MSQTRLGPWAPNVHGGVDASLTGRHVLQHPGRFQYPSEPGGLWRNGYCGCMGCSKRVMVPLRGWEGLAGY